MSEFTTPKPNELTLTPEKIKARSEHVRALFAQHHLLSLDEKDPQSGNGDNRYSNGSFCNLNELIKKITNVRVAEEGIEWRRQHGFCSGEIKYAPGATPFDGEASLELADRIGEKISDLPANAGVVEWDRVYYDGGFGQGPSRSLRFKLEKWLTNVSQDEFDIIVDEVASSDCQLAPIADDVT